MKKAITFLTLIVLLGGVASINSHPACARIDPNGTNRPDYGDKDYYEDDNKEVVDADCGGDEPLTYGLPSVGGIFNSLVSFFSTKIPALADLLSHCSDPSQDQTADMKDPFKRPLDNQGQAIPICRMDKIEAYVKVKNAEAKTPTKQLVVPFFNFIKNFEFPIFNTPFSREATGGKGNIPTYTISSLSGGGSGGNTETAPNSEQTIRGYYGGNYDPNWVVTRVNYQNCDKIHHKCPDPGFLNGNILAKLSPYLSKSVTGKWVKTENALKEETISLTVKAYLCAYSIERPQYLHFCDDERAHDVGQGFIKEENGVSKFYPTDPGGNRRQMYTMEYACVMKDYVPLDMSRQDIDWACDKVMGSEHLAGKIGVSSRYYQVLGGNNTFSTPPDSIRELNNGDTKDTDPTTGKTSGTWHAMSTASTTDVGGSTKFEADRGHDDPFGPKVGFDTPKTLGSGQSNAETNQVVLNHEPISYPGGMRAVAKYTKLTHNTLTPPDVQNWIKKEPYKIPKQMCTKKVIGGNKADAIGGFKIGFGGLFESRFNVNRYKAQDKVEADANPLGYIGVQIIRPGSVQIPIPTLFREMLDHMSWKRGLARLFHPPEVNALLDKKIDGVEVAALPAGGIGVSCNGDFTCLTNRAGQSGQIVSSESITPIVGGNIPTAGDPGTGHVCEPANTVEAEAFPYDKDKCNYKEKVGGVNQFLQEVSQYSEDQVSLQNPWAKLSSFNRQPDEAEGLSLNQ